MDGEIWVESVVNNGSQFMFTIKTRVNPNTGSLILPERMKPFIGRSILAVGAELEEAELDTIRALGLIPVGFDANRRVYDKKTVPNVDAIIVDSPEAVCMLNHAFQVGSDCPIMTRWIA